MSKNSYQKSSLLSTSVGLVGSIFCIYTSDLVSYLKCHSTVYISDDYISRRIYTIQTKSISLTLMVIITPFKSVLFELIWLSRGGQSTNKVHITKIFFFCRTVPIKFPYTVKSCTLQGAITLEFIPSN